MNETKQKTPNEVVRLKPGTRTKIDRIAKANRWKVGETIDALADRYLNSEPQARRQRA